MPPYSWEPEMRVYVLYAFNYTCVEMGWPIHNSYDHATTQLVDCTTELTVPRQMLENTVGKSATACLWIIV